MSEQTTIRKLKINPGDVVLVRGHYDAEAMYELAKRAGTLVIYLDEGQTVETLDPTMMARAGWVRREQDQC